MTGSEIKQYIIDNGVKLWQVAAKVGITDGNFSRRLRKNFTEQETATIKRYVEEIKAGA